MNGYIARKGAEVGVPAPSHAKLAEIVTRIERGELKPSPSLLSLRRKPDRVHGEREVLVRLAAVGRRHAARCRSRRAASPSPSSSRESRDSVPGTGAGPAPKGMETRLGELAGAPRTSQRPGSKARASGKRRSSVAPARIRHMSSVPFGTSMPATTVSRVGCSMMIGATGFSRMVSLMQASMNGSAVMLLVLLQVLSPADFLARPPQRVGMPVQEIDHPGERVGGGVLPGEQHGQHVAGDVGIAEPAARVVARRDHRLDEVGRLLAQLSDPLPCGCAPAR